MRSYHLIYPAARLDVNPVEGWGESAEYWHCFEALTYRGLIAKYVKQFTHSKPPSLGAG